MNNKLKINTMKTLLILSLVLLFLAACDDRQCLKSHQEFVLTYVYSGTINVPVFIPIIICDCYVESSK